MQADTENDPKRLPDAENAEVQREKLTEYCLNDDHGRGKHKARLFRAALGVEKGDWEYLREQILDAIPYGEVTREEDGWGDALNYWVSIEIDGLNGERHPLETRWEKRPGTAPRLTSAWVLL